MNEVTLLAGDVLEQLGTVVDPIDTCVTSPPYFGLRRGKFVHVLGIYGGSCLVAGDGIRLRVDRHRLRNAVAKG